MVGDPGEIRAVAARVRADADRVRWLAGRVAATGEVSWHSPAADLFRTAVAEQADALRRCAGALEDASRLVELHAAAVASARTELARLLAAGVEVGTTVGARVAGAW